MGASLSGRVASEQCLTHTGVVSSSFCLFIASVHSIHLKHIETYYKSFVKGFLKYFKNIFIFQEGIEIYKEYYNINSHFFSKG